MSSKVSKVTIPKIAMRKETVAGDNAGEALLKVDDPEKQKGAETSPRSGKTIHFPSLPSKINLMNGAGGVKEVAIESAGKLILCLGLPPPPGGWFGPFGFFRLLAFAFLAISIFGMLLALWSLSSGDAFCFFAAVLLTVAAVVCAIAAYSHEGLANEVTMMAKKNGEYAAKNARLEAELNQLGGVSDQIASLEGKFGVSNDQLHKTLDALHRQVCIQQLAALLRAFCDADRGGDGDQRLMEGEILDFFDSCGGMLQSTMPNFDLSAFRDQALVVGIGLGAMRFMVNALIAASDGASHKCAAELSLIMFSFDPEKNLEHCVHDLNMVLEDTSDDQIRKVLQDKREKFAIKEDHGRIRCQDLEDISSKVMHSVEAKPGDDSKTQDAGPAAE